MLISFSQQASIECAPHYELNSFVAAMETYMYWVAVLHNIKGFSGNLWHSILIFAKFASST